MYSNYKDMVAIKSVEPTGGLRELKRRRTRASIAAAAIELFLARGFDLVTVAEIAAAAEVSEKTVFNYFPAKAQLIFDAGDELLDELLDAVRHRAVGSPAVAGVRVFIERRAARAERESPPRPTRGFLDLIEASPTLRAYRREMFAHWETTLTELLDGETDAPPGAVEPFVVAVALVGVLRAGFEAPTRGTDWVEHNSLAALELLSGGLVNYAPAPPRQPPGTPPSTEGD
jgi:AcrR family transcriptional regulator